MNTFETIEKAREYAASKPDVTHIAEIEPGMDGINPYVCLKCSARVLELALDRKPIREIKRVVKEIADLQAEARAIKQAQIKANVPGLDALRASYADVGRYQREFTRMMEDEGNDGARPPRPARTDQKELAAKYPAAAAYLKAESWSVASHYAKSGAGNKAMQRIAAGEDCAAVLTDMEAQWSAHVDQHAWD